MSYDKKVPLNKQNKWADVLNDSLHYLPRSVIQSSLTIFETKNKQMKKKTNKKTDGFELQ